jgi:hypothetical protein
LEGEKEKNRKCFPVFFSRSRPITVALLALPFFLVQDNYTSDQPGIQKRLRALADLISRVDGTKREEKKEREKDAKRSEDGILFYAKPSF